MLTISIIFALLVGAWGFSGALATFARRSLTHTDAPRDPGSRPAREPRVRPTARPARPPRAAPVA